MNPTDILFDVVDNALLHLYFTVAESSRFTPRARRNEILVRYLKPMMKDKQYQAAKNELRRLIGLGRKASCDLEATLVELRDLLLCTNKNATDAERLFNLLTLIESSLGLSTRFLDGINDTQRLPDVIYMLQEHVENGFVESGEQIAAVSLFLESDKVVSLVDSINETGLFVAEMQQLSCDTKQGHIVLHPKKIG